MPKTITGTFYYPDGSGAPGATLYMKLSQDAVAIGVNQVAPRVVAITLNSSSQIPAGTVIYANDELTPSGTVYISSVIAPGGGLVYGPELFSISGTSPVNLNSLVPTAVGGIVISYPNPVLQNPSAAQTISGQPLNIASNSALNVSGVLTFAELVSASPNPGQSGMLRFSNTDVISWRNSSNTADLSLNVNNANFFVFSGNGISLGGILNLYNNISTVGGGIPVEYAAVDLVGQTATIATVVLYTTPATGAGQYRLTWNAKVTTPGSVSSTLGSMIITYLDPDGTVQTVTAGALSHSGSLETTDTGNSTTTVLLGIPLLLNCKASTSISYQFGYTASAAASMVYNIHVKLEAL